MDFPMLDWTGLKFQEIMNEAEKIRVTGNQLFKEGKFKLAKAKYEKVLREFNHVNPQTDEEGKVFLDTRLRASSKWENAESPLTHVIRCILWLSVPVFWILWWLN
ncbi:peptidyl-prolyl cis-trans isomerase PASTICCINO1-like isoform X2 [Gossypium hirsutum]|uniref:Peptidyl-prolyl cis-trans isomerase PASTICCINO1-like isoform X2 n=1 Tax=Gossypium hirsutum TaxID=3635 RepID=A0ABM3BJM3_GOSHI|nr:peptidyl-prolyl cis-trans isomerase PASTICCINO1-like isoform X2 [Gossypium hirsutum]